MSTLERIYLDNQASTPVDPRVLQAMLPYFKESFGNPHSSEHAWGWKAHESVEIARGEIASLIGAYTDEIIFTSGATEANNIAILGIGRALPVDKRRILVSEIEHKCILNTARSLLNEYCTVGFIPVDNNGSVNVNWMVDELNKGDVGLVSIMAVNNEIGTVQDLSLLSKLIKSYGAFFHTDAAQAFPTVNIDVTEIEIDLISMSAHKMYGPKGIGALYIKRGHAKKMKPILFGGDQEQSLRPGTLPVPLCVGMGFSASILSGNSIEESKITKELRNLLYDELVRKLPNIRLIGPQFSNRHSGNLNIMFPDVDSHQLIGLLQPNIAISTGSACTSGVTGASHVLEAICLDRRDAESCVRISIGRFTSRDEIMLAASMIADAANMAV